MLSFCDLFALKLNCRTTCLGWGGRTQFDFGSALFRVGNLHLAPKCWSRIYKMQKQLLKITFKLDVSLFNLNTF